MNFKIFKIVLPVFTLMLAITTSVAFAPAENDAEHVGKITEGWIQNAAQPGKCGTAFINVSCQNAIPPNFEICTVTIAGKKEKLLDQHVGKCNILLYKYTPN
ncbi:DUF6520 family protein [Flavivirga eckloniae]|uniref:Secreted protein n=1 Tax=Flavivirga eckloniae TaxID=1803846 RepID=A0A2K9PUL2_9FLAO|nr:DUF6520 family protein [Flavivirga eckloniae]AUP80756.1 hypothetical protein C1H87_19360 [Flavivirga eckloniae]